MHTQPTAEDAYIARLLAENERLLEERDRWCRATDWVITIVTAALVMAMLVCGATVVLSCLIGGADYGVR